MRRLVLFTVLFITAGMTTAAHAHSKAIECMHTMRGVEAAISVYKESDGVLPSGLDVLIKEQRILGARDVVDPWGNRLIYKAPGNHNTDAFDLYSLGRDGVSRSAGDDPDDINNWDKEHSWLYEAYGFVTKEQAARRDLLTRVALGLLWAISVFAVLLLRKDRLSRRTLHPAVLGFAVTIAVGLTHVFLCLELSDLVPEWVVLAAVPLSLTLIACLAFPCWAMPLLCILGIYAAEAIVLTLARRPLFASSLERLHDGNAQYLLVPFLCLVLGSITCAAIIRARVSSSAKEQND